MEALGTPGGLPTIDIKSVAGLLQKSEKIVVLTGAGISTSVGIPDFRSKDTGVYAKLEELGIDDPQEAFDLEYFHEDPSAFYSIARYIFPTTKRFSPTHAFVRLLQDEEKLLLNFTQNIDNLEKHAGILPEKLVHCHGSFATARCTMCEVEVAGEEILDDVTTGEVPRCKKCLSEFMKTGPCRKRKGGRSKHRKRRKKDFEDSSDEEDPLDTLDGAVGVMKPNITFFGEGLPTKLQKCLSDNNHHEADVLIVIGTSLKVPPVSRMASQFPPVVPRVYISRHPPPHTKFDVELLGECDVIVAELCRLAGWDLKHEMVPAGQRVKLEKVDGHEARYTITAIQA